MALLIIHINSTIVRNILLNKETTSIGRRPYNDVVIDDHFVSGEHAIIHIKNNKKIIEDQHSTNGTHLNGKKINTAELKHGDFIDIGQTKIDFVDPPKNTLSNHPSPIKPIETHPNRTQFVNTSKADLPDLFNSSTLSSNKIKGLLKIVNKQPSETDIALIKKNTTVGKMGVAIAMITYNDDGFFFQHLDGDQISSLNSKPVLENAISMLKNGDFIEVAGKKMEFRSFLNTI